MPLLSRVVHRVLTPSQRTQPRPEASRLLSFTLIGSDSDAEPAERDAAFTCRRSLIERVVVTTKEEGLEIELVGAIARMVEVALSAGNRKAVLDERAAYSVKVVSGAHSQRYQRGLFQAVARRAKP